MPTKKKKFTLQKKEMKRKLKNKTFRETRKQKTKKMSQVKDNEEKKESASHSVAKSSNILFMVDNNNNKEKELETQKNKTLSETRKQKTKKMSQGKDNEEKKESASHSVTLRETRIQKTKKTSDIIKDNEEKKEPASHSVAKSSNILFMVDNSKEKQLKTKRMISEIIKANKEKKDPVSHSVAKIISKEEKEIEKKEMEKEMAGFLDALIDLGRESGDIDKDLFTSSLYADYISEFILKAYGNQCGKTLNFFVKKSLKFEISDNEIEQILLCLIQTPTPNQLIVYFSCDHEGYKDGHAGHAGLMIINTIEKEIIRIDPHGIFKEEHKFYFNQGAEEFTERLNDALDLNTESDKYKYKNINENLVCLNPQTKMGQLRRVSKFITRKEAVPSEIESASCVLWSRLFSEAIVAFPKLNYEEVLGFLSKYISSEPEKTIYLIRGYYWYLTKALRSLQHDLTDKEHNLVEEEQKTEFQISTEKYSNYLTGLQNNTIKYNSKTFKSNLLEIEEVIKSIKKILKKKYDTAVVKELNRSLDIYNILHKDYLDTKTIKKSPNAKTLEDEIIDLMDMGYGEIYDKYGDRNIAKEYLTNKLIPEIIKYKNELDEYDKIIKKMEETMEQISSEEKEEHDSKKSPHVKRLENEIFDLMDMGNGEIYDKYGDGDRNIAKEYLTNMLMPEIIKYKDELDEYDKIIKKMEETMEQISSEEKVEEEEEHKIKKMTDIHSSYLKMLNNGQENYSPLKFKTMYDELNINLENLKRISLDRGSEEHLKNLIEGYNNFYRHITTRRSIDENKLEKELLFIIMSPFRDVARKYGQPKEEGFRKINYNDVRSALTQLLTKIEVILGEKRKRTKASKIYDIFRIYFSSLRDGTIFFEEAKGAIINLLKKVDEETKPKPAPSTDLFFSKNWISVLPVS